MQCFTTVGRNIRAQIARWVGNLWVHSVHALSYLYFRNESFSADTLFHTFESAGSQPYRSPGLIFLTSSSSLVLNYFLQKLKQSSPFQRQVNPSLLCKPPDVWRFSILVPTHHRPTSGFSNLCLFRSLIAHPLPLVANTAPSALCSSTAHSSEHRGDLPKASKVAMRPFSGLPYIQTPCPSHLLLKHEQDQEHLHHVITRHRVAPARLGTLKTWEGLLKLIGLPELVSGGWQHGFLISTKLSTYKVSDNQWGSSLVLYAFITPWSQFLGDIRQYRLLRNACTTGKSCIYSKHSWVAKAWGCGIWPQLLAHSHSYTISCSLSSLTCIMVIMMTPTLQGCREGIK